MKKHEIQKLKTDELLRKKRLQRASDICYKYSLFTVLGVTRALERADYHIPSKWYSILDSVRATSSILHGKVSTIDEEIEEEFREKEDMIDRHLGKKKFYDEDEVEKLRDKMEEIEI